MKEILLVAILSSALVGAAFFTCFRASCWDVFSLMNPGSAENPVYTVRSLAPSQKSTASENRMRMMALGQDIRINSDLIFNFSKIQDIGSGSSRVAYSSQGKYVLAEFSVSNNGKEESSIVFPFTVEDGKGRIYEYDLLEAMVASTHFSYETKQSLYGGNPMTLKPGFSGKYFVLIEVAKDSENMVLQIRDGKTQKPFIGVLVP